jgi:glycosyltransferase involved in cell wall biosynthesis
LGIPNHIISRHNTEPFVPGVPKFLSSFVARICTYRSTVIAISDAVKDYAKENAMIASHIPISVVYYGINHQDFKLHDFDRAKWRQQELNCEPEDFVFGTISRLVPQKDLQTLINAFSKISKEVRCKLVIVGDGVQRNELEKLVKSLNLESKVHFLGKRRDIPELLHAIDAFALTSKYEGLGLVLLEALASEVPIIAARNSAIKEIVNDEVALMFETSSVPDLEKAMRDLINDPNETSHRLQRGKVRVQQNFGVDSMLKQVTYIYMYILKDDLK